MGCGGCPSDCPSDLEPVYLCFFAALAGFIDAVVGGGGLIQIPALFLFLPAPLAALVPAVLATNKMSSICGTGVAVVEYARRVPIHWGSVVPAGMTALVFSFLGARTVTLLRADYLRVLVLALLIVVALHTFWRRDFGKFHAPRLKVGVERLVGVAAGMAIGFYDGFFGPGTGSFLIFIFIGLFGFDFLTASAHAKVINFATNVAAVAYFAASGYILWQYALPMAVCNMVGALLGVRLAVLKGNTFIRGFFLVVVTVLIVRFGYEVLLKS
jgi:uncharacterized protein